MSPQSKPGPVQAADGVAVRGCSIAGALGVVGDRWSLLVLRDLAQGVHRFQAIARSTGAPRDVLTARLRKLEEAGVLERRRYSEHPPRSDYVLTASGIDLLPVLLALREWGDTHIAGLPPVVLDHSCGHRLLSRTVCSACGEPLVAADVTARELQP